MRISLLDPVLPQRDQHMSRRYMCHCLHVCLRVLIVDGHLFNDIGTISRLVANCVISKIGHDLGNGDLFSLVRVVKVLDRG